MLLIYILVCIAVLAAGIGCYLRGFYDGSHSFHIRMKIALLKEENARLKFFNTLGRSIRCIDKVLKENEQ
jgi:hypothetical protein